MKIIWIIIGALLAFTLVFLGIVTINDMAEFLNATNIT